MKVVNEPFVEYKLIENTETVDTAKLTVRINQSQSSEDDKHIQHLTGLNIMKQSVAIITANY